MIELEKKKKKKKKKKKTASTSTSSRHSNIRKDAKEMPQPSPVIARNRNSEQTVPRHDSIHMKKKLRKESRECHNHKPQPFPDTKKKRKPTNQNKHKSNKHTKSTKISSLSLFPKRVNRNAKRNCNSTVSKICSPLKRSTVS